ncbi:MAG: hypothetical protein ACI8PZ_005433 [Myxococcota bacterium]|jgi:hypothetical protein
MSEAAKSDPSQQDLYIARPVRRRPRRPATPAPAPQREEAVAPRRVG